MKKRIGIVAGTRPEAIKLAPVYFALKDSEKFKVSFISTGQHKEMLDPILGFFNIEPDFDFGLMQNAQGLSSLSARLLDAFDELFSGNNFDLIVVQGDTTSAFIAGLSAYYKQIPLAHIEAGLRTHDIYAPFPEEVNRRCISTFANLHFAPTAFAEKVLLEENRSDVHMVGNTVIDSVELCKSMVQKSQDHYLFKLGKWLETESKIVAITAHRREQFGTGLEHICEAIKQIAESHPQIKFLFPVHMNPAVEKQVFKILKDVPNISLLNPMNYDEWIFILQRCYLILTDSGGIQEEALALHIPVMVMRDKTERPEGISSGGAILCGTEKTKIIEAFESIINSELRYKAMKEALNPYGDGKSSQRIVSIISDFLNSRN